MKSAAIYRFRFILAIDGSVSLNNIKSDLPEI
jgi:hypothetical protein